MKILQAVICLFSVSFRNNEHLQLLSLIVLLTFNTYVSTCKFTWTVPFIAVICKVWTWPM